MSPKRLTDDELAVVRWIQATDPPATEPIPPFVTESLRRIVESANPTDTLRHEYRYVAELFLRHEAQPTEPRTGT